jgi:hypothetical protein
MEGALKVVLSHSEKRRENHAVKPRPKIGTGERESGGSYGMNKHPWC